MERATDIEDQKRTEEAWRAQAEILDIEGTDKLTPIIVDECRKAPKASFWQKVKAEWRKVESEMKKVEQKAKKTM
jgi:hypothetical protein